MGAPFRYDRNVWRVRDLSCGGWRIYPDLEICRVCCKAVGWYGRSV
jgi:hypothetical protein